MPKIYSTEEKKAIKENLKYEAKKSILEVGLKKTTVDYLIEKVNIPKGTFYLFYKSKEMLIFDVILEEHDEMEVEMISKLNELSKPVDIEVFVNVLFYFYKMVDKMAVVSLMGKGEIEILYRKLPKEIIKDHFNEDIDMVETVINLLDLNYDGDIKVISAAFRQIFMLMMYDINVRDEYFDESLKILIRGVVLQLYK